MNNSGLDAVRRVAAVGRIRRGRRAAGRAPVLDGRVHLGRPRLATAHFTDAPTFSSLARRATRLHDSQFVCFVAGYRYRRRNRAGPRLFEASLVYTIL